MAGHTPWREIKRQVPDTPQRRAAWGAYGRAMDEAQRIAQLQEAGATQVEIVDEPTGDAAAATARRDDLYLAALRGYVEELGGRLVLTAVFPAPPATERRADDRQHAPTPAATPRRG